MEKFRKIVFCMSIKKTGAKYDWKIYFHFNFFYYKLTIVWFIIYNFYNLFSRVHLHVYIRNYFMKATSHFLILWRLIWLSWDKMHLSGKFILLTKNKMSLMLTCVWAHGPMLWGTPHIPSMWPHPFWGIF